jgi:hypothetical protein
MDKSATQFPECDWLVNGFDGNEIGARCADVSANSVQCVQRIEWSIYNE